MRCLNPSCYGSNNQSHDENKTSTTQPAPVHPSTTMTTTRTMTTTMTMMTIQMAITPIANDHGPSPNSNRSNNNIIINKSIPSSSCCCISTSPFPCKHCNEIMIHICLYIYNRVNCIITWTRSSFSIFVSLPNCMRSQQCNIQQTFQI